MRWKHAQAHHGSIPVVQRGAPGAIHDQESEFYSPLLPPAPLAAKFLHWPYANPAQPPCSPLLSCVQYFIELLFLQDSTENITYFPLLTVSGHKGKSPCPHRGGLRAHSSCLGPTAGATLPRGLALQLPSRAPCLPSCCCPRHCPSTGISFPAGIGFSSIQGAKLCTQPHPPMGPLWFPGS